MFRSRLNGAVIEATKGCNKTNKIMKIVYKQGLVISLPYCYLNTEVQTVMRTHYR